MTESVITIPGVLGELTARSSFWQGWIFHVDGERVRPHGFPRNRLTLPGDSGPIPARIKGGLFRAYPTIVVDQTEYPTGPPTPRGLQILALLPLALILLVQGILGFAVAFVSVAVNMSIRRSDRSERAKVGLVVVTVLTAAVVDVLLLVTIIQTSGA